MDRNFVNPWGRFTQEIALPAAANTMLGVRVRVTNTIRVMPYHSLQSSLHGGKFASVNGLETMERDFWTKSNKLLRVRAREDLIEYKVCTKPFLNAHRNRGNS